MNRKLLASASIILSAILGIAVYAIAESARLYLEEVSKVSGGGTPYGVGIFVAGISFCSVFAYSGFMLFTRWNSEFFLTSIRVSIAISLTCSIVCMIWFITVTGLFNIVGLIGNIIAVLGFFVSMNILSMVKKDLINRG